MSIVRTKVMALLLGPTGVGLIGLYSSILDVARIVVGMGISSSGVRQIAEAVGTGDNLRIARTIFTLRRVALILGTAGALAVLGLSRPISRLTFADDDHAGAVALLSLAVLFSAVSGAQSALVQGMRRIGDLARLSVVGAALGTVVSIPVVYLLRERGIAVFLVVVAGLGIGSSWWYARKIKVQKVSFSWSDVTSEVSGLLRLGFVFMVTGLMTVGTAYLVRVFVMRKLGVEAAGYYQAAWALAGLYVGFVLQAMGADFFPRLTAVGNDNSISNRMVNEQTEIGLLIAVPGILGTLTCAPLIIHLFYSSRFDPAVELLQWNCLGMLLRVASWPMGFLIMAKGRSGLYMITETLSNIAYLALVWVGVRTFGLVGAGMAFLGLYLFCSVIVFVVARRLTGFRWSLCSSRMAMRFAPLVAVAFFAGVALPPIWSLAVGIIVTAGAGVYSLKTLSTLVNTERLPRPFPALLARLGLGSPKSQVPAE